MVGHPLYRFADVLMLCHHHENRFVRARKQMDYWIEQQGNMKTEFEEGIDMTIEEYLEMPYWV